MRSFSVGAEHYSVDVHGVIHQEGATPIPYTPAYIQAHMDKPKYGSRSAALSFMRMGLVIETAGRIPVSLLDYGYGAGEFLQLTSQYCPSNGFDLTGWPLPAGQAVTSPIPAEIYTMWDVIEHLPNLALLAEIPAKYLVISTPDTCGKDFASWKHRRPNEHLHHFTIDSLRNCLADYGWEMQWSGHPEDVIRGGPDNILSAGFSK